MLPISNQAEWARTTHDNSWSWERFPPLFKRSKDHGRGGYAHHGSGGELKVEQQRLRCDILDQFQTAAEVAGIPRTVDLNTGNNSGSGKLEVTQRHGIHWNPLKPFLRAGMHRSNPHFTTDALINRLTLDGSRVRSVEFVRGTESFEAAGSIETILAAGAIGSPVILESSRIGDADRLRTWASSRKST
jgi:choline dehydrogenase